MQENLRLTFRKDLRNHLFQSAISSGNTSVAQTIPDSTGILFHCCTALTATNPAKILSLDLPPLGSPERMELKGSESPETPGLCKSLPTPGQAREGAFPKLSRKKETDRNLHYGALFYFTFFGHAVWFVGS